jgi:hypothetical protein
MDKVYYYNRNGVLKLTIGEEPYFMVNGTGEFKNHSWEYDDQFGRFKNYRRAKVTYPFSIAIKSANDEDFDSLCDIFDEDILEGEPGYFMINGWMLKCNVIKAEHTFYRRRDNVIGFEAVSEWSEWIRMKTTSHNGIAGGGSASDENLGRDYSNEDDLIARGYSYGYSEPENHYASIDLAGTGHGYEILVYGPATNPVVYLDNQPVQVNVTLDATQRLSIVSNGPTRTIKILSPSGAETDAFIYRDKEHNPFLTLGSHTALTYGQIRFDFTSIERRSEPTWT